MPDQPFVSTMRSLQPKLCRINGSLLGGASKHDSRPDNRRRHKPPPSFLMVAVPCSPTPNFLPVSRIVPSKHVTASYQQLSIVRNYGAKGFERFLVGLGGTGMLPNGFPRGRIHAKQVGRRIGLTPTMDHFIALKNR